MDFIDVMHGYFRGERMQALLIVPAGVLFLGTAFAAWRTQHGGQAWATAVPAAIFGLILVGVGLGVALRTPAQVAGLEAHHARDVAAMLQDEVPRMQQVMVLFSRTIPTFGVLTLVGLGLRFGLRGNEWAAALGAVLVAGGGIGLMVDGFAARRAEVYLGALERLAAAHQTSPSDRAASAQ